MVGALKAAARLATTFIAACGVGYGAYVAATWLTYGNPQRRRGRLREEEAVLDRFMPVYEVAERHLAFVRAPVDVTYDEARSVDLMQTAVVRAIFTAREALMGSRRAPIERRPLVELMRSIGWGLLAETPGRVFVAGAVTKPWEANVTFRAIDPEQFAAFAEPGFAKIVWAIGARPIGRRYSLAWTETRVATTDSASRALFRRYWALLSPGILLIRIAALASVRANAEARMVQSGGGGLTVSDSSNGDSELLDSTDPIDDQTIERRFEPSDLDEDLHEAAEDAKDSGAGGLIEEP